MTTPWAEVAAKPEFKALPPEQQEAARSQYFDQVVAPQVPQDKVSEVRAQFDAQTKFGSTPGGAAVANPSKQVRIQDAIGPGTAAIGRAGALGAAIGVVAPELLTGAAGAAAAFPVTARAAPLLSSMAAGARAAGRGTGAVTGGVSGLTSETAGQGAEALGAGTVTAEGARLAGGVTPELARVATHVARLVGASHVWKSGAELAQAIARTGGPKADDLTDAERAYLEKAVADLRGGPASTQPMMDVHGGLQAGASGARTAAQQAEQAGQQVLTAAQQRRLGIGADRETGDIGTALRDVVVKRNADALESRSKAYTETEKARDAIVAEKEAAGQSVTRLPEYTALVDGIKQQLLPGVRSPDVQRGLKHVLTELEGSPGEPRSFRALDDIRRKLGDVFSGKPAEGYDAIGAKEAERFYAKIRNIQVKYAGAPQEELLSKYAEATGNLGMFGSKAGKRATAVDRYDDSKFVTDASAMPAQFFKTAQGVRDLKELVGDQVTVSNAALDFATNQLRDKSAPQVRAWLTANRDWIREVPEVQRKVGEYAMLLERGEQQATQFSTRAKALAQQAGTLEGDRFPVDRVRKLVLSGSVDEWAAAGPAIAGNPQSKAAAASAVRQVLADKLGNAPTERAVANMSQFFADSIRPAIEGSGIVTKRQADEIAARLAAIDRSNVPQQQKLGFAKRFLLETVGGYAASAGARMIDDKGRNVADLIPPPRVEERLMRSDPQFMDRANELRQKLQ